jgi:PEP-CTERM motif
MRIWKVGLGAVLLLLVSAASGWCDSVSINLVSSIGGLYDYGLTLPGNSSFTLFVGDLVSFTGLSGVTGAVALDSTFNVDSFTATMATFKQAHQANFSAGALPFTFIEWEIDSSVLTLGTINWSIAEASGGTLSGTMQGPVATTPEPGTSSLMLIGVGLVFLVRKRIAQGMPTAT